MKPVDLSSLPTFEELLSEKMKNRKFAAEYLIMMSEEENPEMLLFALKTVIDTYSGPEGKGLVGFAKKAGLHRASLHRSLTGKQWPRLPTLNKICDALDLTHISQENRDSSGKYGLNLAWANKPGYLPTRYTPR